MGHEGTSLGSWFILKNYDPGFRATSPDTYRCSVGFHRGLGGEFQSSLLGSTPTHSLATGDTWSSVRTGKHLQSAVTTVQRRLSLSLIAAEHRYVDVQKLVVAPL